LAERGQLSGDELASLPECAGARGHDEDGDFRGFGKAVEDFLAAGERASAIDSFEWDGLLEKMSFDQVQCVCPAGENDATNSVSVNGFLGCFQV
jgi:hypothetical protein